jgi:hypothetical protein
VGRGARSAARLVGEAARPRIHRGGVGSTVGCAGDEVTSLPGSGAARRLRLPPTPYLFLLPLGKKKWRENRTGGTLSYINL